MSTNLYGIFLWQMKTFLVNEKWEIYTIHRPWFSRRSSMVSQLQVGGYVPKKYLPMNLFNIHYSRKTLTIDM